MVALWQEKYMVSLTISLDEVTYDRLRRICDLDDIKTSLAASKMIRLGIARRLELEHEKKQE